MFISKLSGSSITRNCKHKSVIRFGKKICIVDTPGLFDTEETNEKVQQEIAKCITLTSPGPHAFILVLSITRYTQEETQAVKHFVNSFGSDIFKYFIILFTRKDELDCEGETILEYIGNAPPHLQSFIKDCGGRVVAFNNRLKLEADEQVKELLSIIKNNVEKNKNKCYTNKMYERAEQIIREREAEIRKEAQMERDKELKAIEDKLADEFSKEAEKQRTKTEEEFQKWREEFSKKQQEELKAEKLLREKEAEEYKKAQMEGDKELKALKDKLTDEFLKESVKQRSKTAEEFQNWQDEFSKKQEEKLNAERLLREREAETHKKALIERDKELKAKEDKLAAQFSEEVENQKTKTQDLMQEWQEKFLKDQEEKWKEKEKELQEKCEQQSAGARDVVREEVAEGKTILGWIWEGVKLILPGIFSKVF